MTLVFRGPTNLAQLEKLAKNSLESFYQQHNCAVEVGTLFWRREYVAGIIDNPNVHTRFLPATSDQFRPWPRQSDSPLAQRLLDRLGDFTTIVSAQGSPHREWGRDFGVNSDIQVQIFDYTLFQDIVNGQVFDAAVKTFLLDFDADPYWNGKRGFSKSFVTCKHLSGGREIHYLDWKDKFVQYFSRRLEEAKQRLDQQVSKAAFDIMRDLHS